MNNNHDLEKYFNIEELMMPPRKEVRHYCQTIPVNVHHFYLSGEISEDNEMYISMINALKTAEQHDTFYIYVNSRGGALTTTIQIMSAMEACLGHIITVIEGEASSAATFIFLKGDSKIVNDDSYMMIHNYSHGPIGKGNEVASRVKFYERYFAKIARKYYTGLLTSEEIETVISGTDIWLDADEVTERLKLDENGTTEQQRIEIDLSEKFSDPEITVEQKL